MVRLICVLMLGLALWTFSALPAQALSVDAVRVGVHPDKTRMVLELSDISDFRAFVLDDPTRLVIDLPSFAWRAARIQNAPGSAIGEVRHGELQPGISRIVFDTHRPIALKNAFVLPRAQNAPPRLVVDFAAASPEEFRAARSRVMGTLEIIPLTLKAPGHTRNSQIIAPQIIAPQGSEPRTASVSQASSPVVPPPIPPRRAASNNNNNNNNNAIPPAQRPLIILDPGHGGQDPGAHGANGAYEKHITLALARELRDRLEATGRYRVMLTRDKDVFIKLSDRVKFARKHGGDLFISIHADSIDKPNVGGASIYTLSDKASDEQTARLAARENQADLIGGIDLRVEDEEVASILVDLAMRDTMNQSRFFAASIVDMLAYNGIRTLERPHRYAGFAVLKAPDIPSILIEAGFMSNRQEANLLSSAEHRGKIAAALVRGIDGYFQTVNGDR